MNSHPPSWPSSQQHWPSPSEHSTKEIEHRLTVLEETTGHHEENHDEHYLIHDRHLEKLHLHERALLAVFMSLFIMAQDKFPAIAQFLKSLIP